MLLMCCRLLLALGRCKWGDLTFSEAAVGAGQKPFAAMFLERQWHFPACTHYEKHDFGRFSKMMYDCGPSIQWKG